MEVLAHGERSIILRLARGIDILLIEAEDGLLVLPSGQKLKIGPVTMVEANLVKLNLVQTGSSEVVWEGEEDDPAATGNH